MTTHSRLWSEFERLPFYERWCVYALVLEIVMFKYVLLIVGNS
ncbi:hypothetical protein [Rhizobium leguminosarum]